MSDILTIRVSGAEKAQWQRAAAEVKESVADFVREAVRQRVQSGKASPWEKHIGSVFSKLGLNDEGDVNRRVMAVLAYHGARTAHS